MPSSQTRSLLHPFSLLPLLLLLALTAFPSAAQMFGWGGLQQPWWGQAGLPSRGGLQNQGGCMWGSQAVAVPGQCGAYQCVSPWLGSAYTVQCPFGTLFSTREGSCMNPMRMAAQCGGFSALRTNGNQLFSWFK